MSEVIKIKRGLDIPLVGEAGKDILPVSVDEYALKPPDFPGLFPKLLVREGDQVKAGSAIYFDKYRENIRLTSPVSGTVTEVFRGPKRKLLEIRIKADAQQEYIDFGAGDPAGMERADIVNKLIESGTWAYIRQRPYNVVANPDDHPKAIHISAFDSSPIGVDFDLVADQDPKAFEAGLAVLQKLTDGKVHLNVHETKTRSDVFLKAKGVQLNRFSGPHPSGNVGIQIHHVDPVNKGEVVWVLDPQATIIIGRLFLTGKYMAEKVIAFAGSEVEKPCYVKVMSGASVQAITHGRVTDGNNRYISGSVLTGENVGKHGYLGFYANQLTVIPEGDYYEMFGWIMPRFHKFSYNRSYFSWLMPRKKYRLDTNMNGGHRAFVLTGEYEKVFPMDIYPMQLLKAIMIKDIDLMENLGIYEVAEEDFALCEFIDASKTEMQAIVREGLDYMRKEMS
ncbi:MAG: Na(+)-translocating NADH-quinone reductase subunit A [Bacteroidales bacterium]